MDAADIKALKSFAKSLVIAAKHIANTHDGYFDEYSPDEILQGFDNCIGWLKLGQQSEEQRAVVNYDKYITQIEKIRDKFIAKYGASENFVQTAAGVNDAYIYPAEDVSPIDSADFSSISLIGVVAE